MKRNKQDSVFSQLEVGKEYEQEVSDLGEETKSFKFEKGELVVTPHGDAIITIVDDVDESVRVKHLEAKTPVTDYRFSDITKK